MQIKLTGQFTDKLTRCQSSHGLANLQTSQLADSELKNNGITTLYLYTKPSQSLTLTLSIIDSVQIVLSTQNHTWSNNILQILTKHFCKLRSPRVDQSAN